MRSPVEWERRLGTNAGCVSDVDIAIRFTWWQIAFFLLAMGFWPLSLLLALAAIWVWKRRTSRLARIAAALAAGLWLASGFLNLATLANRASEARQYDAALRARQTTLARGMTVAGFQVPAGTVVTHDADGSGAVSALDLPAPVEIAGVPVKGHVPLSGGALDGYVTLARDARIDGLPCSAQTTPRFASGKLLECRLVAPSRVHGVPCSGDIDLEHGVVCELAADYLAFGYVWRAGTKLTDFGDQVWFRIGERPPSLRAFGMPLGVDSEVQWTDGHLAAVDLRSHPAPFRGCSFDLIMVDGGVVTGRSAGACSLPLARGSPYVELPQTVTGPH